MGFFNNLNDKLQNFMVGRNGADRLARWSMGAALLLMVLNIFLNNIVILAISYAFLFYCIFRIFSRDPASRAREDERFSRMLDRAAFWRKGAGGDGGSRDGGSSSRSHRHPSRDDGGDRAASRAGGRSARPGDGASGSVGSDGKMRISCETCGQSLSVPKGRGTLKVTCPKCNHQMRVKS